MSEHTRGVGHIRVIKARDRVTRGGRKPFVSETDCAIVWREELRRRFADLRRAYLAVEQLMAEQGIELKSE